MAHTKALGSTRLGRDSASKRLGIKRNHGQAVGPGQIIVRQRGTKYVPGKNVMRAGDDTLFSRVHGTVQFVKTRRIRFDGNRRYATEVRVAQSEKSS